MNNNHSIPQSSNKVTVKRVLKIIDGKKQYFLLTLLLIIAVKFFLIRNSEVLGSAKDSWGYILMANQKIWFPTNNGELNALLGHSQGYSIFILFSSLLNFPLRISHEIFYILSNILGSSLPFMLNQHTRCQDNILLTQKFRKFLKP
ncbi:hypothetical protein [Microcystis aeruginosa]|uniref:hypothetical protein n=1 Tax=Microcystis aeruginosa TaxID=1126 RepID=UPI0011BE07BC|nr:hypothetical protein [Microcystis aeruginosa]